MALDEGQVVNVRRLLFDCFVSVLCLAAWFGFLFWLWRLR
jgi:hypothetical protein